MKQCAVLFVALALVLVGTQAAQASDGHLRWDDLAWRVVNFVLFVGIIWWAGGKKISAFLRGRRESIAQDLDDLEQARAQAQQKLRELDERIANVDAECAAILAENRAQAESARERIIEDAKRQAEEIVQQARVNAENEARRMEKELRAVLADRVVDAVKASLAERLDPAEHDRLITNALKKVVIQ